MADNSDIVAQMQDYLDTLKGAKPDPSDPAYADAAGKPDNIIYQAALAEWGQEYRQTITLLSNLEQQDLGLFTLPDGTIMPLDKVSPQERAAIDANNLQIYNQLLEQHGLSEYSLRRQSAMDENSRRMDEYTTKVDELRNKQSYDDSQLSRSLAELDRWMSGQDVAGKDADRIQTARQEATRYGTSNGKTSFSGRDLGAGVSMLAQQGGIGADAPLLNYPGVQTWDPVGDREASMASMGLGLAPPEITPGITTPGDIPMPPSLSGVPTYGGGAAPAPPALLPPWDPNPAFGAVGASVNTANDPWSTSAQPAFVPQPPKKYSPMEARLLTAR